MQKYNHAKQHLSCTEAEAKELERRAREMATKLVKADQQLRYSYTALVNWCRMGRKRTRCFQISRWCSWIGRAVKMLIQKGINASLGYYRQIQEI